MAPVYLVLLHHPVFNKRGDVVVTAITNMDIHDLARIARTYGAAGVFIAHPVRALRLLSEKIVEHWSRGYGAAYNETRREALALVRTVPDLDSVLLEIERETGTAPVLIATSARAGDRATGFAELRERLRASTTPHLLMLGTGWGLVPEVLGRAEIVLEPIRGAGDYNHLPVRAAAAIMLDRLLAPPRS
ncbi:MAG: hypothetical protein QOD06_3364 [Candidatus Binatota bacterium]|nr:hypothetical protein [Candidatus Binatota bacterium]